MDRPERRGAIDEIEPVEERGVERFGELAGAAKGLGAESSHVPGHDAGLLRLRVDRHDPRGLIADAIDDRIGHLAPTLERLDATEQHHLGPLGELLEPIGLVEERDLQIGGAVGDVDDHHRAAAAHRTLLGAHDLHEKRRLLPHLEFRDAGLAGPIDVATRVVQQHVEHGVHTELGQGLRRGLTDALEIGDRQRRQLGETSGHDPTIRCRRGTDTTADHRGGSRPRSPTGCRAATPRGDG